MARKRKVKLENLVVLQYAPNICYTKVRKFDTDNRPEDVLSVNLDEGTWETVNPIFGTKSFLQIGKERRRCPDSCRYGTIGIYDSSNIEHLNKMLHDAEEATQETLVCYD